MAATAPQTAAPSQSQTTRAPTSAGPQSGGQSGAEALTQSVRGMDYGSGRDAVRPPAPSTPFTAAERQTVVDEFAAGKTDENELTDDVFAGRHPEQPGMCPAPGTPEAQEWMLLRDQLVRPVVAAAKKAQSAATPATAPAPAATSPAAANADRIRNFDLISMA